ncbi:MAG: hypothetical protein ACK56I_13210, partial [bacterium]
YLTEALELPPHQSYLVKLDTSPGLESRRILVQAEEGSTTWYASTRRQEAEEKSSTVDLESLAYRSVITTGMVFWCIRGVQIFATILAVTPTWIQLDPMTILSKATDKEETEGEVSEEEKIFDQKKS